MDSLPPPPSSPAAPPTAPPTHPGALGDAEYTAHRFWRCPSCGQPNDVDRGAVRCPECGMSVAAMREVRAFDDRWRDVRLPVAVLVALGFALAALMQLVALVYGTITMLPALALVPGVIAAIVPRDTPRLVRAVGAWSAVQVVTVVTLSTNAASPGLQAWLHEGPRLLIIALVGITLIGFTIPRLVAQHGRPSLVTASALALTALPLTTMEWQIEPAAPITTSVAVGTAALVLFRFLASTARHALAPRTRRALLALGGLLAGASLIPALTGTWSVSLQSRPVVLDTPVLLVHAFAVTASAFGGVLAGACTIVLVVRLQRAKWHLEADASARTHVDPAMRPVVSTSLPAAADDADASR